MAKGQVYKRINKHFELEIMMVDDERTGIVTKSTHKGFPVWTVFSVPELWELVPSLNMEDIYKL